MNPNLEMKYLHSEERIGMIQENAHGVESTLQEQIKSMIILQAVPAIKQY